MSKTNFTKTPAKRWALFCLLFLMLGHLEMMAQPMACNDLVQVSVDGTPNACQAEITADMILEGNPIPGHDYFIEIKHNFTVVASGTNLATITNASQYFGLTLNTSITDLVTENSCWGSMYLEDKLAPVITCNDVTISCADNLSVAAPTSVDNCDPNPTEQLTGETTNTNSICSNGYALIERTYVAVDNQGNVSVPCIQHIYVERPTVVDFPNDIAWHCDQYAGHQGIVAAAPLHPSVADTDVSTPNLIDVSANLSNSVLNNTGSGVVANIIGTHCKYQQSSSDQVLNTCGNTFKILRTWTVIDWCNSSIVTSGVNGEDNIQVIKVADRVKPTIQRAPFSVSANLSGINYQGCRSTSFLQAPTAVSDNCNDVEVKIFTPVGEAVYVNGGGENGGFIPSPGLPTGVHDVTYQATDACGNQTVLTVPVTVVDDIVPIAICDEITDINLGSDGYAIIPAEVFDDGSYDNCCFDKFLVRRMDNICNLPGATTFGPTVTFCCEDIGTPAMVVFRVQDCDGNVNDCMVEVNVSDKIAPILLNCPADQRITCDWYMDNLETQLASAVDEEEECAILTAHFGAANFFDNCEMTLNCDVVIDIDQCLEGEIRRTWTATDQSGNTPMQNCVQRVYVDHVSDWSVIFPEDILVDCGTTVPDFGEPVIFKETCELVAVSYEDVLYTNVPDACYKIARTWTIINWCVVGGTIDQEVTEVSEADLWLNGVTNLNDRDINMDGFFSTAAGSKSYRTFRDSWAYSKPKSNTANQTTSPDTDPDSDPWDGYIVYEQIIKVLDTVDPVFVGGCEIEDVCIEGITCGTALVLPTPEIDECSPDVNITAEILFGNIWFDGFGPHANVGPGTYQVRYVAEDNCNNQTACETTVTVVDCKKPTPYCKTGIVVELMVPVDPNDEPMVEVWASDLDDASFDNCPGTLTFSFTPDVNDLSIGFDCADVGQNPVQIWVTDAQGNQDFCETAITIQSNMAQCPNAPFVATGGMITNETNEAVADVTVNLNGQMTGMVVTGQSGMFDFANIPVGNDVTITPEKNDDPINGVTTYDLVLISKHILGVELLDSPYKIIAADANNSKSVTTFDLVEIRKMILLVNSEFPNNSSWRFIDKDYVFPDPQNPWEEVFPEVININNISSGVLDADFNAIKIGDVNASAAVNLQAGSDDRNAVGSLLINAKDRKVSAGETFALGLTSSETQLLGYQFTLNFDQSKVELKEVQPGIADEGNFGLALLDKGALTTSWFADGGVAPAPGGLLFGLVFTAKENGRLSDMLSINSRFTIAEAYDTNGGLMDVELNFDSRAVSGFELYQNMPNPFDGQTKIGFNLPEAGKASLSITDIAGRVIYQKESGFGKGYNEVTINSDDLPSFGVMYYTLETAAETATRKMVLTNK